MATFTFTILSGSTSGRPIPVAATATPGTAIHTAAAGAIDKVWLSASNVTTGTATLTIEWGGVTDPGDHMVKALSIAPNSPPVEICYGQPISGGLTIRAFSGTASAINITGHVVRYQ